MFVIASKRTATDLKGFLKRYEAFCNPFLRGKGGGVTGYEIKEFKKNPSSDLVGGLRFCHHFSKGQYLLPSSLGGAVAQSAERATSPKELVGSIPSLVARSFCGRGTYLLPFLSKTTRAALFVAVSVTIFFSKIGLLASC